MPRRAFMLPAMRFPAPVLALAVLTLAACRPKPLSERAVGTYVFRREGGYTTMTLRPDGTAEQVSHFPGSQPTAAQGRYSAVGDTLFIAQADDASPAVLHGDSLIVLVPDPNVRRYVFLREK